MTKSTKRGSNRNSSSDLVNLRLSMSFSRSGAPELVQMLESLTTREASMALTTLVLKGYYVGQLGNQGQRLDPPRPAGEPIPSVGPETGPLAAGGDWLSDVLDPFRNSSVGAGA